MHQLATVTLESGKTNLSWQIFLRGVVKVEIPSE